MSDETTQPTTGPGNNTATIMPDGPLKLSGDIQLDDERHASMALCRCGYSQNKPFCDGSHRQHSFDDNALAETEELTGEAGGGTVTLKPVANGPVIFSGELTVQTADGEILCHRSRGGLCRCGASKKKPFCDGSHKDIGFEA